MFGGLILAQNFKNWGFVEVLKVFAMSKNSANAMYLVGACALVWGIYRESYPLALVSALIHVVVISVFSAVVHRYFCHKAFEANSFLMWALSIIPTAYNYATPMQWAVMHSAHHAYADTDKDPHLKGWKGIFTATYRAPPKRHVVATKWFRDGKHDFTAKYSNVLIVVWNALLASFSIDAMIWFGLVPVFTLSLANGFHRAASHLGRGARNLWYLEYLIPMGGEWIHDEHHNLPKKPVFSNRWFEIDTGGLIVKAVKYG